MPNRWMTHLNAFRKAHPKMKLSDAMTAAKASYKKQKGKGLLNDIGRKISYMGEMGALHKVTDKVSDALKNPQVRNLLKQFKK